MKLELFCDGKDTTLTLISLLHFWDIVSIPHRKGTTKQIGSHYCLLLRFNPSEERYNREMKINGRVIGTFQSLIGKVQLI